MGLIVEQVVSFVWATQADLLYSGFLNCQATHVQRITPAKIKRRPISPFKPCKLKAVARKQIETAMRVMEVFLVYGRDHAAGDERLFGSEWFTYCWGDRIREAGGRLPCENSIHKMMETIESE